MRYRFDNVFQARKHLHPVEGRQLLFFPDPFLDVRDGQPVQVELCVTGSEQTVIARGDVHSLETGTMRGAWLDIRSQRTFDGILVACGNRNPRRLFRRVPADLVVRVQRPGVTSGVARLVEVSAGGARIVGAGRLSAGDEILVSELYGPPLRATVVRAREGEIAVEFLRSDATTRRHGVKLVEAALQRWTEAREARHPPACSCLHGGALYEPLLPRSSHRRVEGL